MTFFAWLWGSKKREDLARVKLLIQSGFAAMKADQYESARVTFSKALEFRGSLRGTYVLDWLLTALSFTYMKDEKFEEEIIFFSDYLLRYPDDTAGYSARATAFWYIENWSAAVNDYSRILEVNPENIDANACRGQVLA